uniref:Uncharacterized protein n=1 Tax=Arundo donax TaxID=35708 RepID=A0A0A8YGZ9_ARUDO
MTLLFSHYVTLWKSKKHI